MVDEQIQVSHHEQPTELRAHFSLLKDLTAGRLSPRMWRIYVHVWLVCLAFPVAWLLETRPAAVRLISAAAGLVIFIVLYTGLMRPYPLDEQTATRFRSPGMILLQLGILTALVLALSIGFGSAFLWLFVGASAAAGKTLPTGKAQLAVTVLPLLTLGAGVWLNGGIGSADWLHLIPLALLVRALGLDMVGLSILSGAIGELQIAREELAHQAVVEERLRLARDLHDLLGHTLSLITLKSELAGRLIPHDPVRAGQEISEVEQAARQALREVREAVAGYRQPTLSSTLFGARQMLEAAGIACQIDHTAGVLLPAADSVLGWAVREGVTNVIRHSRARYCTIRVDRENGVIYAEVINDGYPEQDQDSAASRVGSGLSGLAERIAAQGGQMQAGPLLADGMHKFRLRIELPMTGDARE